MLVAIALYPRISTRAEGSAGQFLGLKNALQSTGAQSKRRSRDSYSNRASKMLFAGACLRDLLMPCYCFRAVHAPRIKLPATLHTQLGWDDKHGYLFKALRPWWQAV